jgi:hypothetical protein
MTTTAIFVELLIIGIQAAVWVILLCAAVGVRLPASFDLSTASEWEVLVTAVAATACYSLGILIDRLADLASLLAKPSKFLLRIRFFSNLRSSLATTRLEGTPFELAFREGRVLEFFSYYRSRIRLVRALTLNAFLATLSALLYGLLSYRSGRELVIFLGGVIVVGGAITVSSFLTTGLLEIQYDTRKVALESFLSEEEGGRRTPALQRTANATAEGQ